MKQKRRGKRGGKEGGREREREREGGGGGDDSTDLRSRPIHNPFSSSELNWMTKLLVMGHPTARQEDFD